VAVVAAAVVAFLAAVAGLVVGAVVVALLAVVAPLVGLAGAAAVAPRADLAAEVRAAGRVSAVVAPVPERGAQVQPVRARVAFAVRAQAAGVKSVSAAVQLVSAVRVRSGSAAALLPRAATAHVLRVSMSMVALITVIAPLMALRRALPSAQPPLPQRRRRPRLITTRPAARHTHRAAPNLSSKSCSAVTRAARSGNRAARLPLRQTSPASK
jgi:hypothetical protein